MKKKNLPNQIKEAENILSQLSKKYAEAQELVNQLYKERIESYGLDEYLHKWWKVRRRDSQYVEQDKVHYFYADLVYDDFGTLEGFSLDEDSYRIDIISIFHQDYYNIIDDDFCPAEESEIIEIYDKIKQNLNDDIKRTQETLTATSDILNSTLKGQKIYEKVFQRQINNRKND